MIVCASVRAHAHSRFTARVPRKDLQRLSVVRRRRSLGRAGTVCGTSVSASGSKVALEETGRTVTGINTDRHTPSTHISLHARLEGKKKKKKVTRHLAHITETRHMIPPRCMSVSYAQCHVPFLKLTAGRSQAVPSRCPTEIDRNDLFFSSSKHDSHKLLPRKSKRHAFARLDSRSHF